MRCVQNFIPKNRDAEHVQERGRKKNIEHAVPCNTNVGSWNKGTVGKQNKNQMYTKTHTRTAHSCKKSRCKKRLPLPRWEIRFFGSQSLFATLFSLHPFVRFIYCFRIHIYLLLWFVNIAFSMLLLLLKFRSIRFCAQQSKFMQFLWFHRRKLVWSPSFIPMMAKNDLLRFPHKTKLI